MTDTARHAGVAEGTAKPTSSAAKKATTPGVIGTVLRNFTGKALLAKLHLACSIPLTASRKELLIQANE
jgi:hypothetical protein